MTHAESTQTFRAATPRAALAKVKTALGPDAVILATREVGGGLLSNPEVEIVAAPGGPVLRPAPRASTPPPQRSVRIAAPSRQELEAMFSAPSAGDGPSLPAAWKPVPGANPRAALALELEAATALTPTPGSGVSRVALRVLRELEDAGVAPMLARELVLEADAVVGARQPHLLREQVLQGLVRRMPAVQPPWKRARRTVVCLVGATGTGKTTTLAKMAATARMDGRSVLLITTDTYRVGATDAFARYGDILGVRCMQARNREELVAALAQSSAYTLVLVDTAGRTEPAAIQRQAALLENHTGLEVFLTVSAVGSHRDVAAACDRYAPLSPRGVIFTKLDEAAAVGGVFSAPLGDHMPLAGITNGQRIPEDLHPAEPLKLVERILP